VRAAVRAGPDPRARRDRTTEPDLARRLYGWEKERAVGGRKGVWG
jgi:hypothetical protein